MNSIYSKILSSKQKGKKLLAILLDPDKLKPEKIEEVTTNIDPKEVDFIFIGGSTVKNGITEVFVKKLKSFTEIPLVLFPGDFSQINKYADAILFLSLLSGRNPEYLIEQQIQSVPLLQKTDLEIISTGYILIDGGIETAVQRVSETIPISPNSLKKIVHTACAGMYLGNQLIYLEAGSGAQVPVPAEVIKYVKKEIKIPLIVGGGIRTKQQLETAYKSGADLVVVGTAFEENNNILNKII